MPFRCTMYTDRSFMPANYPQQLHSLTTGLLILQHILSKPSYSVPPFKLLSHQLRSTRGENQCCYDDQCGSYLSPCADPHICKLCVYSHLRYHMQHTSFTIKPQLTLQLLRSSYYINLSMRPHLLCSIYSFNSYINCYNLYPFYSRKLLITFYILCSLNCINPPSRLLKAN